MLIFYHNARHSVDVFLVSLPSFGLRSAVLLPSLGATTGCKGFGSAHTAFLSIIRAAVSLTFLGFLCRRVETLVLSILALFLVCSPYSIQHFEFWSFNSAQAPLRVEVSYAPKCVCALQALYDEFAAG